MTDDWQEGYDAGYASGYQAGMQARPITVLQPHQRAAHPQRPRSQEPRPKRKLSAWNKFVKANSKKPRFKYKSGANKGKLNLKAMAVAFRRTPVGKKSKK